MRSITISIPNIEAAKQFVNVAEKYNKVFMQIENESLAVDPHSIMGVLSLDLDKPMVLQTEDSCPKEFLEAIQSFAVTEK